ncbi:MAG TPA: hypothetical protein VMP11_08990 [Verrucomicrobiae bacterium]|nr:hypothetical protein [Verrucomicrobiae bacterium]
MRTLAAAAVIIFAARVCNAAPPPPADVHTAMVWNAGLPNLELENVSVTSERMVDAWADICRKYGVRSVLYDADPFASAPFAFERQKCSTGDLFNAFAATYNLMWTVDGNTGVIWFHPKNVPYDSILPFNIGIPKDLVSVPMQTGVLEPLSERSPRMFYVHRCDPVSLNGFDYPVSLSRGSYTVRDILNYCIAANPTTTFYVQVHPKAGLIIQAVCMLLPGLKSVPPGVGSWWKTQIGDLKNQPPSNANQIDALSDPRPQIRHAARYYLEALSYVPPSSDDALLSQASPYPKKAWVALGIMSVRVRVPTTLSPSGLAVLQRGYSENLFSQGNPQLATLAAFELAREAGDTNALDIVMNRHFPKGTLDEIRPDLAWLALKSDLVRTDMIEANPKWEDFSADDIKTD